MTEKEVLGLMGEGYDLYISEGSYGTLGSYGDTYFLRKRDYVRHVDKDIPVEFLVYYAITHSGLATHWSLNPRCWILKSENRKAWE